jgi:sortase B
MKKHTKIIIAFLLIIIVALCGITLYMIYIKQASDREYEEQQTLYKTIKPEETLQKSDYLAGCLAINSDTVGWIYIPGTEIDFPVVQCEDNEFYLKHNFYKEYSELGVPFLDYRCAGDFSDFVSIIYGHHIKGGMLFSGLDYYKQQDYLDTHKTGTLITPDKINNIQFFACVITQNDNDLYNVIFLNEAEKRSYIEQIQNQAVTWEDIDVEELLSKHFILLSTCSYEYEDARTILVGYVE